MNPSPDTIEQPRADRSWPQLAAPDAWAWAKIRHVSGHVVECDGLQAPLGALCEIETNEPEAPNVPAEVVLHLMGVTNVPRNESLNISSLSTYVVAWVSAPMDSQP